WHTSWTAGSPDPCPAELARPAGQRPAPLQPRRSAAAPGGAAMGEQYLALCRLVLGAWGRGSHLAAPVWGPRCRVSVCPAIRSLATPRMGAWLCRLPLPRVLLRHGAQPGGHGTTLTPNQAADDGRSRHLPYYRGPADRTCCQHLLT